MRILIVHFRSAPTEEQSASNFLANPDDSAGTYGVSLENNEATENAEKRALN